MIKHRMKSIDRIINEEINRFLIKEDNKEGFIKWLYSIGKKGTLTSNQPDVNSENIPEIIYNSINNYETLNNILIESADEGNEDSIDEMLIDLLDSDEYMFSEFWDLNKLLEAYGFDEDKKNEFYCKLAKYLANKMDNCLEVKNGMVYVERCISVSDLKNLEKYNGVGGCWSYMRDGGCAYAGDTGDNVTFIGLAKIEDIDIEWLVIMDNWCCNGEYEVRLSEPIQLVEIEYNGEMIQFDNLIVKTV